MLLFISYSQWNLYLMDGILLIAYKNWLSAPQALSCDTSQTGILEFILYPISRKILQIGSDLAWTIIKFEISFQIP